MLVPLLALIATTIPPVGSSPVTFTIDVSSPITSTPLNLPLLDCVGVGHATLLLRADMQGHITRAAKDIGFKHIRGHGVLDDDMSTFLNGGANMYNVFTLLDFLLSVSIKPILELSFMPAALAADPSKTIMHYKGITSAPADWAAWSDFITEFVSLLVEHYGVEEVRKWRMEVWNEPGYCGFYCPAPSLPNNFDSYMKLYNTTAQAIRGVDGGLSVGGPATAVLGWVDEFLAATKAGGMPVSFFSSHSYPTDASPSSGGTGNITRTSFEEALYEVAAKAAAAGLPFVMTETSAGWEFKAYDAPFAGSWIIHQASAFLGVANVPTMSYWSVSDIFEEPGQQGPWTETYGIQTIYGVPKPAYRALEFLAALPPTGLPCVAGGPALSKHRARSGSAANATATAVTVDLISALDTSLETTQVVHALLTNFNANIVDQEDPTKGLPIEPMTVTLTLANFPPGAKVPPTATLKILDSTQGWARNVWVSAGKPAYPSRQEINDELAASVPGVMQLPVVTLGGGGVSITLPTLEPYAFAYVTLEFDLQ